MIKILIPIDGTEPSLAAVHHVLTLVGAGLRARFVLANVQEGANLYELVTAHDPEVLQRVADGAGRDLLKPALGLLAAAGQTVETVVLQGDVTQALIGLVESHGVDAIVMGAGTSGLGLYGRFNIKNCYFKHGYKICKRKIIECVFRPLKYWNHLQYKQQS